MRVRLALLLVGGVGLTAWAWRLVHTPLEGAAAAALADLCGVDRARVSVGAARLAGPTLTLTGVRVGALGAAQVEIAFDPFAALARRVKLRALSAVDVRSPLGEVARASAVVSGERTRVVATGARLAMRVPVELGEIGVDLRHGRLERAAFADGRVGPLGELAGSATVENGRWSLRVARA